MMIYIQKTAIARSGDDLPQEYARQLRRADPFIVSSVITAHSLIGNEELSSENCGLIMTSSYGPMETNFEVLDQVVEKTQTSPTLFSHSVFNAAAGYLTRIFQLHNTAFTFTDFHFPFFRGVEHAIQCIKSRLFDTCLIIQTETYSNLLQEAKHLVSEKELAEWPTGSNGWLISSKQHEEHNLGEITTLTIETHPVKQFSINFSESLMINKKFTHSFQESLSSSQTVTEYINAGVTGKSDFSLLSSQGKVKLSLSAGLD